MNNIDKQVWEMWRDLLHEVPEAEQAVRDYVISRRRRLMAEAVARVDAQSRETDALVQAKVDAAVDELIAAAEGSDDTRH